MPSPESTASRERALAKLLPLNGLLAALPEDAQARLLPHLGLVDLRPGQRLLEQGGACVRAFFPMAGLVSLTQEVRDGWHVQVALVGSEGLLGLPVAMAGCDPAVQATVQCAGYGLALGREQLMAEWDRGGRFKEILLRYSQGLQVEISQMARCRRHHSLEQQLCTLVLMTSDRLPGLDPGLTADRLAQLLGVSAGGMAQAVRSLHESGALAIRRDGALSFFDRAGMQARACGCLRRMRGRQQLSVAAQVPSEPLAGPSLQSRINASISSALTGTPREISSQPLSPTIASSSIRMPML